MRDRDRRHHFSVRFDRHRLQDRQDDFISVSKKFRMRMAGAGGVELKLLIDDVVVAIRAKCENAHPAAEFEVNNVDGAADAREQVDCTEGAGDAGKYDATFKIKFGLGRQDFINVGERRPQRSFDVVASDRVIVYRLTDEAFEIFALVDEKHHGGMERGSALSVSR